MKRVLRTTVVVLAALLVVPVVAGIGPAGAAPDAPDLVTPADGASVSANPILQWGEVATATRYRVQIATTNAFTSTILNDITFNTRSTPSSDLPQGTLYWRVAAIDGQNAQGQWSVIRSFSKVPGGAPAPVTPADGATLNFPDDRGVFSWNPLSGVRDYTLQIATDDLFTNVVEEKITKNTSYTLTENQAFDTWFYWRVRGNSPTGNTTQWSDTRSYRFTWPDVANLTYPPDAIAPSIEEVVLAWDPVPGAATYNLEVSPNIDFSPPLSVDLVVKGTQYSPPTTLDNGAYFWRVQAITSNNNLGGWSDIHQFTRAWPAPDSPPFNRVTLLTPANLAFIITEPEFSWTPVRLASRYEVQISLDVNFTPGPLTDNCYTNHTTLTPKLGCGTDPDPGTPYYWRVRPIDDTRNVLGLWSSTFQFAWVPNAITITGPAPGASTSAPILTWDVPTDHIGRYRVIINKADGSEVKDVVTSNTSYVPSDLRPDDSPFKFTVVPVDDDNRSGLIPGLGSWRSFSLIDPVSYGAPSRITPDGTADYHLPTLSWTPAGTVTPGDANQGKYRVWVRQQGTVGFQQISEGSYITVPAFAYRGSSLSPGMWEWYTEAFDKNGGFLGSTGVGTVEILDLDTTVLTSPAHCPPNSACPSIFDTPELDWDRVPHASHYKVYLANDANFTNILATYETRFTSLTPQESLVDAQAGQAIYWYAQPCYGNSPEICGPHPTAYAGASPPIRAFRKQSRPITLLSPAPNATVANQITFVWEDYLTTNQAAPPVTQEAKQYEVQVSTTPTFDVGTVIDTSPKVDQTTFTAYNKTYPEGTLYWRVRAIDGSGNFLTYSEVRTVVKSSGLVSLVSPAPGATVTTVPTFTWEPQNYAATYDIEVYSNPDDSIAPGNKVFGVNSTRVAAATPTQPLPAGDYGWRVRRRDADNRLGPWSAQNNTQLRRFTLGGSTTSLISPSDGAVIPDDNLLFQWTAVPGASEYRIQVSTSAGFGPPLKEERDTVMTSWAPVIQYGNGVYYWRVLTLDGGGNPLAVSASRSFSKGLGGSFTAVTPFRILDSRPGPANAGFVGPVGSNSSKNLQVAGAGAVPGNATAVVMNVTVTGGTLPSYLTVYPAGEDPPTAANLLFGAGQTVPNLVTVKIGSGGQVGFYNQQGTVNVIGDVVGFYDDGTDPDGSLFNPIPPVRLLDSRTTNGSWPGALGPNATRSLDVAGRVPIPNDATAVVLNVTATGPSAGSFLQAYPTGVSRPVTANLLFGAGQTVPNLVVVGIGTGGKVDFYNQLGTVHVIADAVGYFKQGDGDRFHPISPDRFLDSRTGIGFSGAISPPSPRFLDVTRNAVPDDATAVVANMTATGGTLPSFLAVAPTPMVTVPPTTANLLFAAGETVPNAVYVGVGTSGRIDLYNQQGSVHAIVDVAGYFAPV